MSGINLIPGTHETSLGNSCVHQGGFLPCPARTPSLLGPVSSQLCSSVPVSCAGLRDGLAPVQLLELRRAQSCQAVSAQGLGGSPCPALGALTIPSPVPEALGAVALLSEPFCTLLPDLLLLFKRKVVLVHPVEQ